MKITKVEEHDGTITATVRFPDGFDQTVNLPAWASKQNIKQEANRLRDQQTLKEARKKRRRDLEDTDEQP